LSDQWIHEFFSGAAVDFWLAAAPPPDDDVAFLQTVFGAPEGKEILDVACGGGRHTIPLARAGYEMTGTDISAQFLGSARTAADAAGAAVDWLQYDMRELPWSRRFEGALCFGNSFGYVGRKGTDDAVASIAATLRPGAAFVLEIGTAAESLLPALTERRWIEVGGILFFSSSKYIVEESRLDVEYSFLRGDQRETKTAHMWIFTTAELRDMFDRHGLAVEALYASPQREPYRVGSPRLILVARKR
jgi:SAM-dependent methyltransferase